MNKINIGKKIDYKTLENILVNSAEEIGWKAEVEDNFNNAYSQSDETVKDYNDRIINLKSKKLPIAKIMFSNKDSLEYFSVCQNSPFEYNYERKIKKYLDTVSKNLSKNTDKKIYGFHLMNKDNPKQK